MAASGRRQQIVPGPWSRAVAEAMSTLIDAREGRRKKFGTEAGMSTRLSQLLNGKRAWYLEDVERCCRVLGLDVVAFLASLDVEHAAPALRLIADSDETYLHEDIDADYDGGA